MICKTNNETNVPTHCTPFEMKMKWKNYIPLFTSKCFSRKHLVDEKCFIDAKSHIIRCWLPKQITFWIAFASLVISKLFVTVTSIWNTIPFFCCPEMTLPKNTSKGIHTNYYYGVWWLLHLTNINTIYYIRLLFCRCWLRIG